jgi:GT2 family glycosyltransferase/glycosyltransferase involved in cell wall biosynthesis
MKRRVTVIVLCWNRWDLTSRCLDSLRRCTDFADVEIIAVDNGSQDETPEKLRQVDWVRTIRSETNLGFVRGNNLGLSAADPASDVVLLNNDTEVLTKAWLERLQRTAHSAPDIGVVGCRLLHSENVLSCAGAYVIPDTCRGHFIGVWEMDVGQYGDDRDVPTIIFACAYIRREVLNLVGPLPEVYETYFEDTDYCLRAREAGYRIICCGSVSMLHLVAGSTEGQDAITDQLYGRSWQTFRQRWGEKLQARYRYDVCWRSIVSQAMRFNASDRKIVRELDSQGIRISYTQDLSHLPAAALPPPPEIFDPYVHALSSRESARPQISVILGPADAFDECAGEYRIGFTTHDSQAIPRNCVVKANELDELWFPNSSSRDAFERCGLVRPTHVIPLGVDTDYFHPRVKEFKNPAGDYVFLTILDWSWGKAHETLLRVFNETFSRRERVALVCKVTHLDPAVRIQDEVGSFRLNPLGGRIRLLVNRGIPYYQFPALYRSADCYILATHVGEWDLSFLEAMSCGLPAIVTDRVLRIQHVPKEVCFPVKVRESLAALPSTPEPATGPGAGPDPDHLSALLRHVFQHRDDSAAVGRKAAAYVSAELSLHRCVTQIETRLDVIATSRGFCGQEISPGT